MQDCVSVGLTKMMMPLKISMITDVRIQVALTRDLAVRRYFTRSVGSSPDLSLGSISLRPSASPSFYLHAFLVAFASREFLNPNS